MNYDILMLIYDVFIEKKSKYMFSARELARNPHKMSSAHAGPTLAYVRSGPEHGPFQSTQKEIDGGYGDGTSTIID